MLRYETKFEDFLQNEVQDPMYYLVLAANNSLLLNIYEGIIILSAKSVSGYTIENKTYRAPSLALHYGTTLQRICDLTTHLLIKKCSEFVCNYEEKLNEIKRLRFLIETHWNNEVSSLALKDLEGKKWNKTCYITINKRHNNNETINIFLKLLSLTSSVLLQENKNDKKSLSKFS